MSSWLLGLAIAEKIAVVLGAVGVIFAALSYWSQKRKAQEAAVIEQIAFFRKEVIVHGLRHEKFLTANNLLIKKKDGGLAIAGVPIDVCANKFVAGRELLIAHQEKINLHAEARQIQLDTVNALEEFALRVLISGTVEREELKSVKYPFVSSVDRCAVYLMDLRSRIVENDSFSKTLKVYELWAKDVTRH